MLYFSAPISQKKSTPGALPPGPVVPKAGQGCDPLGRGGGHSDGCSTPGHHVLISTASPLPQMPPLFLEVLCRMQRWERTCTKPKHSGNVTPGHKAMYVQSESPCKSPCLLKSTVKAYGEGTHEEEHHLSMNRVQMKATREPLVRKSTTEQVSFLTSTMCYH